MKLNKKRIFAHILNMNKKIFSARLRQLRKATKLTQAECAKNVNVYPSVYHEYENDNSPNLPSYDTLISISVFFNVSIDYLLGITENSERK